MYKKICEPLSKLISHFFNKSIFTGKFPSCLKTARIVPVPKGGDNTLVKHFRPICILNLITKIFEKLIHSRLNNYLITSHLLCDHQFGFKKDLCTSDALAEFVDFAYESINANHKFIAIYLDFSKAFDTVDYEILL